MCWGPDKVCVCVGGAHGGNKHRKTEIKQENLVVAVLLFVPAGWHKDQFIYSSSSVSRALLMAERAVT